MKQRQRPQAQAQAQGQAQAQQQQQQQPDPEEKVEAVIFIDPPALEEGKELLPEPLNPRRNVCNAMDTSGSTSGSILKYQIEFAKQLGFNKDMLITWNSYARKIPSIDHFRASGTTVPSNIFRGEPGNVVAQAPVLCLMTDGEVNAVEVRKMSQAIDEGNHQFDLVIGVVTSNTRQLPGATNISVLASLMAQCPNFIGLFVDYINNRPVDDCYIVAAKGAVFLGDKRIESYPISEETKWEELPKLPFKDLQKIKFIKTPRVEIPDGYVNCGVDEGNRTLAINFQRLFRTTAEEMPFERLQELPWGDMLRVAKIQGWLGQIREWFKGLILPMIRKVLAENCSNTRPKQAHFNTLVANIARHSQFSGEAPGGAEIKEAASDEVIAWRKELSELRPQLVKEKHAAQELEKQLLEPLRTLRGRVLNQIADMEKGGYNLAAFASNRAARAADAGDIDMSKLNLDHSKSPAVRCQVCLDEQNPGVLLLGPQKQHWDATSGPNSNYALNFPLACGFAVKDTLLGDQICADCAPAIVEMGTSLYRRPVLGNGL